MGGSPSPAVCADDEWLDAAEVARVGTHAADAWRPLLAANGVAEVREDGAASTVPRTGPTDARVRAVQCGAIDVVLLTDWRPYCPPGRLAYVLGPRGAAVLLAHAFPVEQRVDSLIRGLAASGHLRVCVADGVPTCVCPVPGGSLHNAKRALPVVTLGGAAVVLLAAVAVAAIAWVRRP